MAQPAVPLPEFNIPRPINLPSNSEGRNYQKKTTPKQSDPFTTNELPLGATAADVIRQTNENAQRVMGVPTPGQSSNRSNRQTQLAELKADLAETNANAYNSTMAKYQSYIAQFQQMNPDNFSITKAVYLSEAAFYSVPIPYETFEKAIKQKASIVRQLLAQEGLSIKNTTAVHYGIQKLYSQDNLLHNNKTGKDTLVRKLKYDFDDFFGKHDWTKMFVTKMLKTNAGQCHSMPLLYLCIAEQLNTKAFLALSPDHSFIQYYDSRGKLRNFETTNGNLVTMEWLIQSTDVNATALKNKSYLYPLTSRKLYAQCLADLQRGYIKQNGYDEFSREISNKILALDSTNINGLMTLANDEVWRFDALVRQYNFPPKENLYQYPELQQAFDKMMVAQEKVNATGYAAMPEEEYKQWLQSIEIEKEKQRFRESEERKQEEIEQLKKINKKLLILKKDNYFTTNKTAVYEAKTNNPILYLNGAFVIHKGTIPQPLRRNWQEGRNSNAYQGRVR
jgi:hypothetical protein